LFTALGSSRPLTKRVDVRMWQPWWHPKRLMVTLLPLGSIVVSKPLLLGCSECYGSSVERSGFGLSMNEAHKRVRDEYVHTLSLVGPFPTMVRCSSTSRGTSRVSA
jgi:hypothetical protein